MAGTGTRPERGPDAREQPSSERPGDGATIVPNVFPGADAKGPAFVASTADGPAGNGGDHGQRFRFMLPASIGADLERVRSELAACTETLAAALPHRGDFAVNEMSDLLRRLTCRVAVIGQIKAGKSSFINALIRRPGFLPTHVNPWTTAITNIHFGRGDAPGDVGARFTFFDRDEWDRLAAGGGRLRELTERLVPGFEAELLRHHLEAMRHRTERRLGEALSQLLGQAHDFRIPSRELLDHYVCSGPDALDDDSGPSQVVFSDVVKQADLYFGDREFGFPTTLIDTPGTNDPFIVRDEITRRALETADVYVIVLTARQALSHADISLLRILRGLHKDRIAIFINRIDELDDIAADVGQIAGHVRQRLQIEFPGADLPIIVGSARWALTSMSPNRQELGEALTPRLEAYARSLGLTHPGAPAIAGSGGAFARSLDPASLLLMASGMPALNEVLARLAINCHAGHVLQQVARSFGELARYGDGALRQERERQLLDEQREAVIYRSGSEELRDIHAEVEENQRLTSAVHALLIDLQARTDQIVAEHDERIRAALQDTLRQASDAECQRLAAAMQNGLREETWVVETSTLRRLLRETLLALYREGEQHLTDLETFIIPKLRTLVQARIPEARREGMGSDRAAQPPGPLPSIGALAETVALDLSEPWWRRWWSGRRVPAARLAELDELICSEFEPIISALAEAGRDRLVEQRSAIVQNATMVFLGLVEYVQERSQERLTRTRELISQRDAIEQGVLKRQRQARLADIDQRHAAIRDALRRLDLVERRWERMSP